MKDINVTYQRRIGKCKVSFLDLSSCAGIQVNVIKNVLRNESLLNKFGYKKIIDLPNIINIRSLYEKTIAFYEKSDFRERRTYWTEDVIIPILLSINDLDSEGLNGYFNQKFGFSFPKEFCVVTLYYGCGSFVFGSDRSYTQYNRYTQGKPGICLKMELCKPVRELQKRLFLSRSRRVVIHELCHLVTIDIRANTVLDERDEVLFRVSNFNTEETIERKTAKECLMDLMTSNLMADLPSLSLGTVTNPLYMKNDRSVIQSVNQIYEDNRGNVPLIIDKIGKLFS